MDICSVVAKPIEQIIGYIIKLVGREIGYLVHRKENIQNLEQECEKLHEKRCEIHRKVDATRNNGNIIDKEDNVWKWLMKVHGMQDEVDAFLGNKMYFIARCPNICLRYRLSKEALKKITDVKKLEEEGNFDEVGHPAPHPSIGFTSATDYVIFESRKAVFEQIMKYLSSGTIYAIGVYGIGGTGKTRLVQEVGKKDEHDKLFDKVVNIVVSQTLNEIDVQQQLAEQLDLKLYKETKNGRAGELYNMLINRKKRILVIVDDVWSEINLCEIGIPLEKGNNLCKILLTSRSKGVCHQMNVQKAFHIEILTRDESWDLFKEKVGSFAEFPEIKPVAQAVCGQCGGLPIAILAVGAALKSYNSKQTWDDALEQLRKGNLLKIEGVEGAVFLPLKWSYDYLKNEDAKSCFLICTFFPEDDEISIDELLSYGMGMGWLENTDTMEEARNRVHALVDILKASCLLEGVRDRSTVKMHDVIRDVAICIASGEEHRFLVKNGARKWPKKDDYKCCTAISLSFKSIQEFPDELECPELQTLVLECINHTLKVPKSFLNGLEKLKVLHLINMNVSSLPTNLVNLRMLCLTRCEFGNMSVIKELKQLEILSLGGSNIEELAPEIRCLTRLRCLDLRKCYRLRKIPPHVLSSLTCLEELFISSSFDRWKVEDSCTSNMSVKCGQNVEATKNNASLIELNSLASLVSLEFSIFDIRQLPRDVHFEKLIRFKIFVGEAVFPVLQFSYTKKMKLSALHYREQFNVLMRKVEALYLCELTGLENILHDKYEEDFVELKFLCVSRCNDVEHLFGKPNGFSQARSTSFSKLTKLYIYNCDKLKYLFSSSIARVLLQLEELGVHDCDLLEEIIGNERVKDEIEEADTIVFRRLKELSLDNLRNIKSFCPKMKMASTSEENPSTLAQPLFNEKVVFPALETLMLSQLQVREIWDNQSIPVPEEKSFCQVRKLEVIKCPNLVNVFSPFMVRNLENLETLHIAYCNTMEEMVATDATGKAGEKAATAAASEEIIIFPRLKILKLERLEKLRGVCNSRCKEEEETTREVKPEDGPQAQTLFHHKLTCSGSTDPRVILRFPNLNDVVIVRCDLLRNLFPSSTAAHLEKLQSIRIKWCSRMREVVTEEGTGEGINGIAFPELRHLRLSNLKDFTNFCNWRCDVQCPSLESPKIKLCPKMKVMASGEGSISLRCSSMEYETILCCPKIRTMAREVRGSMRSFNHMSRNERSEDLDGLYLTDLLISKDVNSYLRDFPSSLKLKVLKIVGCNEISSVMPLNLLQRLQYLEELTVKECDSVQAIFDLEGAIVGGGHARLVSPITRMEFRMLPHLTGLCNQYPQGFLDFQNIRSLKVEDCPLLASLFSSTMGLWQLEESRISSCGNLEEVIATGVAKEVGRPSLTELTTPNCPKLKALTYSESGRSQKIEADSNTNIPKQRLFKGKEKVEVPAAEELGLSSQDYIEQLLPVCPPIASFGNLRSVNLYNCCKLSSDFSSKLAQVFHWIKSIRLVECNLLEEVFNLEGFTIEEPHAMSSSQLEDLYLESLPGLVRLWKLDAPEILVFNNLTRIEIVRCHNVRNLFTLQTARNLPNLEELEVLGCDAIEEIITTEEQRAASTDKFVFSRMKTMTLYKLSNITTFCRTECDFELPSLTIMVLSECPKMRNFISRRISTPVLYEVLMKRWVGGKPLEGNLNQYVQEEIFGKHIEEEEERIWGW